MRSRLVPPNYGGRQRHLLQTFACVPPVYVKQPVAVSAEKILTETACI